MLVIIMMLFTIMLTCEAMLTSDSQESHGLKQLPPKPQRRAHSLSTFPRLCVSLAVDEMRVHVFHFAAGSHVAAS